MLLNRSKEYSGVFKGIFTASFILILHVSLITGIVLLMFFFQGLMAYAFWIFLFCSGGIFFSGYLLYRRAKKEGKALKEILALPLFNGRTVEVSFMGGLASIKVGRPNAATALTSENNHTGQMLQLESQDDVNVKELASLVYLLEHNLITKDEYKKAKKKIFKDNQLN